MSKKNISPLIKRVHQFIFPLAPVQEKMYDEFLGILTADKIIKFSNSCKSTILEKGSSKKEPRLTKKQFLNKMKSIFCREGDYFNGIFFLLFERFKVSKCEIRMPTHKNDVYFISDIASEDIILIYDIIIALSTFLKTDMKEKLSLLFMIIDHDEDGYINEEELKKFVYTIHIIFADEIAPYETKSSVINRSLASIKSGQTYNMIMNYPGELGSIFSEEKYINFDNFYEAILKIPNYKFVLFPFYVNFKISLNIKKTEEEYTLKQRVFSDFTKISSEMINAVKKNSDIGRTFSDFRKSLEPTRKGGERNRRVLTRKAFLGEYNTVRSGMSSKRLFSNRSVNMNLKLRDDTYEINYNKISGLETYPGKFKVIDTKKEKLASTPSTATLNTMANTMSTGFMAGDKKLQSSRNILKQIASTPLKERKITRPSSSYMTYNEMLDEIQMLINKHKNDDYGNEELIQLSNKIKKEAFKYRIKLKNPAPNTKLVFGKFK